MTSSNAPQHGLRVTAPARLHLGFLDLNGEIGRMYGSIGLALDQPATILTVRAAEENSANGPEADRVLKLLRRFNSPRLSKNYAVVVEQSIPAHAGLGSGTQLALALGRALFELENRDASLADIADLGARGPGPASGWRLSLAADS